MSVVVIHGFSAGRRQTGGILKSQVSPKIVFLRKYIKHRAGVTPPELSTDRSERCLLTVAVR